jgi:uncharacterized protein
MRWSGSRLVSGLIPAVAVCLLVSTRAYAQTASLIDAAADGDLSRVRLLLDSKADVNAKTSNGFTALTMAARNGHADVARLLLDAKADVDAKTSAGATPLILAAQNGHAGVARLLLDFKADVNAKTSTGATPLFLAAQNGHADVARLLLDAKADVNAARSTDGATALMMASVNGHADVARLLLDAKADVNAKTSNGFTALTMASQKGYADVVQLIETAGAPISIEQQAKFLDGLIKASGTSVADSISVANIVTVRLGREDAIIGRKDDGYYFKARVKGWSLLDPRELSSLAQDVKDDLDSKIEHPLVWLIHMESLKDKNYLDRYNAAVNNARLALFGDVKAAVLTLYDPKEPRAVAPLITALKDTDWCVRMNAANALERIKDPRAVGPLIAALNYRSSDFKTGEWARISIRMALGEIGTPAIKPLIEVLSDSDRDVRMNAAKALYSAIFRAAWLGSGSMGGGKVALNDWVASELGRGPLATPDPSAVQALTTVLVDALNDTRVDVRKNAASMLSELPDHRATVALLAVLKEGDTAVIAMLDDYFIRLGVAGSEDALIRALYANGNRSMAVDFLNCGNSRLEEAANVWARTNGYTITKQLGGRYARWGGR